MIELQKYILVDGQTLMIIIGVALFIWLTISRLDKTGIGNNNVNKLIVICIISAFTLILGARFFDCFWHATENGFFKNLPSLVKEVGLIKAIMGEKGFFSQGGITFLGALYGALFGYVISYLLIFKHERHNIIHYLNIILPGLILAHGLGRIGCFLVGCCTGIEAPAPFGMYFPYAPIPNPEPAGYINPHTHTVLPANLYEAIFLIGLFFVLIFALKKHQTKVYMVSYGIFRFLIEFLRGDSRGQVPLLKDISFLSWVSPSQLLSFILLIVGILLFIFEDKLVLFLKRFNKEQTTKSNPKQKHA